MAGRGGKRLGAGRKSAEVKILGQKFFEGVCSHEDLKRVLRSHLLSADSKISLQAAIWLSDHLFGKAKETVEHEGEIDLKHMLKIDL